LSFLYIVDVGLKREKQDYYIKENSLDSIK